MAKEFSKCKMHYQKDSLGKEVLLKDGKFQVMMEWEKPYMHACIDALKPFGDVLEIGFGLAYSAEHIQSYHPKSHTIIEFHPEIAAKARDWAKGYPNVKIIEATWQHALPTLGIFDCIFFDDYPLESEEEMQKMKEESQKSNLLLQQGKEVIQDVEKTIPFLKELKYSNEDLAALMYQLPLEEKQTALQFATFLKQLSDASQITAKQLNDNLQTLLSQNKLEQSQVDSLLHSSVDPAPYKFSRTGDRLFDFLSKCLQSHMRKGSRFSCFLSSAESKYQDERFVNEIIVNANLDFHEEQIDLEVPPNCDYFSGNAALVIKITKMV